MNILTDFYLKIIHTICLTVLAFKPNVPIMRLFLLWYSH